jgi:hypothetical protein
VLVVRLELGLQHTEQAVHLLGVALHTI